MPTDNADIRRMRCVSRELTLNDKHFDLRGRRQRSRVSNDRRLITLTVKRQEAQPLLRQLVLLTCYRQVVLIGTMYWCVRPSNNNQ